MPFFSVIVPTYDRRHKLTQLLRSLRRQTDHDFEVIIVDQTPEKWHPEREFSELDLRYVHLDTNGAVLARNTGALIAKGEVFAFTDDDCLPEFDWLANARVYFNDASNSGVEGRIVSTSPQNPVFRGVSNMQFEGLGFMCANLFLRRRVFQQIGGFDVRFDHPHFREDTDLGWRALEHGNIPFANDVRVFHPLHNRNIERESVAERSHFFEKDPLLMAKHPNRYKYLFLNEAHFIKTDGFCEHFVTGAEKYGILIEDFYKPFLELKKNLKDAIEQMQLRIEFTPEFAELNTFPDENSVLTVEVVNRSMIPLCCGGAPFAISYHLLEQDFTEIQRENERQYFRDPLSPEESRRVELAFHSPPQPGTYFLELDLIWDRVTWLKYVGIPGKLIKLNVMPLTEAAKNDHLQLT